MKWKQVGKLIENWRVQDFHDQMGQSVAVLHNGSAACLVKNSHGQYLLQKDLEEEYRDISFIPFMLIHSRNKVMVLEHAGHVFDQVALESIFSAIMDDSLNSRRYTCECS